MFVHFYLGDSIQLLTIESLNMKYYPAKTTNIDRGEYIGPNLDKACLCIDYPHKSCKFRNSFWLHVAKAK